MPLVPFDGRVGPTHVALAGYLAGRDVDAPVPEPGTLVLLATGLGAVGLVGVRRRRRARRAIAAPLSRD